MLIKKNVKMLFADAKNQTNSISAAEVYKMQQAGTAKLIDIRDIRELQREGRIDCASHAPRGMLELWADPASPYHKNIFATKTALVLFCASGWRFALAAKTLQDMGMDNIWDLDGRFTAWKAATLPIKNLG
jgi:rhodanese-related sulfurtransferase